MRAFSRRAASMAAFSRFFSSRRAVLVFAGQSSSSARSSAPAFEVVVVVAIFRHAVRLHHQHAVGDAVDEIAVVGDGQNRPLKAEQRGFQAISRLSMSKWLVGSSRIGSYPAAASALSAARARVAAERSKPAPARRPREQEASQRVADGGLLHARGNRPTPRPARSYRGSGPPCCWS